MARYMFSVSKPFFDYCVQKDIIAVSPMAMLTRPKRGNSRERFLSSDEIKRFWHAASQLGYPYEHFYKLALLTGQRNDSEVASLEWSEINGDVWTIPSSKAKNGRAHVVHLGPLALQVLQSIPRKSHLVFTNDGHIKINDLSKNKAKLDKLMGVSDWVVHDLRRTMVTVMASELKIDSNIADRILNHVSKDASGVAGVYQKYQFLEERKQAVMAWGEYIETLTNSGQH
jgi:integrase